MPTKPRSKRKPLAEVRAIERFARPIDAVAFIYEAQARGDLDGIILQTVHPKHVSTILFGKVKTDKLAFAATKLLKITHED